MVTSASSLPHIHNSLTIQAPSTAHVIKTNKFTTGGGTKTNKFTTGGGTALRFSSQRNGIAGRKVKKLLLTVVKFSFALT
jgi:hypothetical protein